MDTITALAKKRIRAVTNTVAREEAEKKGYKHFRIDKESLKMLEDNVAITAQTEIKNARSQCSNYSMVYRNESSSDYIVPEARVVDVRHNAKQTTDYSADVTSKIKPPKMGKVNAKQALRATGQDETHVHERYAQGYVTVPRQCTVHFNSAHHADTRLYELVTEGNILIVVHPGHPIAKHAAIGGGAGAAAGGVVGGGAGSVIGGMVGVVLGPPGIAAGAILGGVIGGLVGTGSGASTIGGMGSAIGAARGVVERNKRQFTITAEDVFRRLPNFRKEGAKVFCWVTLTREWDVEQREITKNR